MDTGIDDSHTDLAGRVVAWSITRASIRPSAGMRYSTPTDKGEHGSHVSGIGLRGRMRRRDRHGDRKSVDQPGASFPSPIGPGYYRYFPVDTTGATGNSTISAQLKWNFTSDSSSINGMTLNSPTSTVAGGTEPINGAQPLQVNYAAFRRGLSATCGPLCPIPAGGITTRRIGFRPPRCFRPLETART